ncbi:WVD2-like protein 7 [Tanacetum coccineum]
MLRAVRYAPFEALYGRKCRSPIMWAEIREGRLIGPELVQETTEKISQIKDRLKAGNNLHGLGDSVSLGRFASESLAWEKWSNFPHNRYVEEAKNYAQPGSVAEKKAFFEAYFNKVAAQKPAAVLLEQKKANAAATCHKSDVEERAYGTNHATHDLLTGISNFDSSQRIVVLHPIKLPPPPVLNLKRFVNERKQGTTQDASKAIDAAAQSSAISLVATDRKNKETLNNTEKFEDHPSVSEDSGTSQMDPPLSKHKPGGFTTEDQRKPATLSFRSSSYGRKQSRIPLSPANYASMHPRFQKLEDAQKVQLQTTLKEKAETELRRLRQSFCFKARPLPSFYNERETPKSPIKKTSCVFMVTPVSFADSTSKSEFTNTTRKPPTTISQPSSVKKSSRRLWKTSDQNPADHPLSKYAALIDSEDTHYPMYIISQPSSVQKSSRRLWKTSNQNPADHPLSKYAALIDSEDTHYPIYIISQPSSVKNSSKGRKPWLPKIERDYIQQASLGGVVGYHASLTRAQTY